jgi:hypothetical protein
MRQPFDFTAQVWAGPIRNPQITLTPITAAQTTVPYSYQVVASDPQGNPLTYSLSAAPTGMTVSGTGLVSWTPNSVGTFPVGISVNVRSSALLAWGLPKKRRCTEVAASINWQP